MLQFPNKLPRHLRWALLFPLYFFNGWLLVLLVEKSQPLFNMLIIASLVAFLLETPLGLLQKLRLPRGWAIAIVVLVALLIFGTLLLTLIPLLVEQLGEFVAQLPEWIDALGRLLESLDRWAISQNLSIDWNKLAAQLTDQIAEQAQALSGSVIDLVLGTLDGIITVLFTIILTIFFLIYGERFWKGILSWLPPWLNQQLQQSVPRKFGTFVRGQVLISLSLSVILSVAFLLLNIPFALLFGFTIGMASLLPFMGAVSQVLIGLFLMVQDFGLGLRMFVVALILGQINDNIVSPKLMGSMVSLNPLWLFIAVFIGAKLGGILGLFIAIPIASIIKEIVDNLKSKSNDSSFQSD